ncbi:MAG: hypothetical protein Tsb004_08170 [Allomuricauda sp.]
MSSHGTEQLTLFTDLHLKQDILSEVYSHLGLRNEPNKDFLAMSPTRTLKNKIYSFTYVPDYMDTVMAHTDKQTQKRYPSVYGYAIDLKNCNEVDDYMRTHLNKRRKSIARSVRRLEQSFETSYKMYLGDMDVDQYHFLMGRLKSMITQRFKQKGHESDNLAVWDKVLSTSLELIRAKKASLFVIYVKDEPIVISFNYNYGPVLFSYISSYDINYGKFSPGQVEIYKQLEWCLANGYNQFDMGWGGMGYKQWWSNKRYRFYHHILYPKHSLKGLFYALWKGNKSKIIAYLISKGVNTYFNELKSKLKKNHDTGNKPVDYQFEERALSSFENLEKISLNQIKPPMSKEIVNDFLFLTQEHSNDVSLYYDRTNDDYFLVGKKKAQIVLFHNSTK